jgi:hypothetical protein
LASSELTTWLQEPQSQQYAPQQQRGYSANDAYGDHAGGDHAGNGWDEPQGQGYDQGYDQQYDWDRPDQQGSYGGQQDPYGAPSRWNGDPYQQDDYPAYPNRGGYGRGHPAPHQALQPDRRAPGRKDDRPRGWRAFFRRK